MLIKKIIFYTVLPSGVIWVASAFELSEGVFHVRNRYTSNNGLKMKVNTEVSSPKVSQSP